MKVYLAGNFPQLKDPETEKAMKDRIEKKFNTYRRLITFFYPEDCETIFTLQKQENSEVKKDSC